MSLGAPAPDDALLLRWVPESRLPVIGSGRTKPASDTWVPSSDDEGTSVVIVEGEVTPEGYLIHCGHPALMSVLAREVRAIRVDHIPERLDVIRDDLEDGTIYGSAHALVIGWPQRPAHKKVIRQRVLDVSEWVGDPIFRPA